MVSPVSQALETAAGKVRSFLGRAGFFWRGGAVIAGVVFASLLLVAFTVREVYESESVIAFEPPADAPQLQDDAVLSDRLHAALLDPRTLERVTRGLNPELANGSTPVPSDLVERIRQSIALHQRGPRTFGIAFRAGSAAYAQHGCQDLTQLAIQYLDAQAAASSPAAEDAARRAKELEDKTRELAGFVAAHPEVTMSKTEEAPRESTPPTASSSSRSSSSSTDAALVVLQQEKAKLEARLAEAEKQNAASAGGEGNPYDPSPDDDPEALRQMIAQVKVAITARQNAATKPRRDDSSAEKKAPTSGASASPLRDEWQRLVQAVIDAQKSQPAKREIPSMLRIVQSAPLPSTPVKPNRPVLALVGLASGLWMGVLWAFARVALGHDAPRVRVAPAPSTVPPTAEEDIALAPTVVAEPRRPIALLPAPSASSTDATVQAEPPEPMSAPPFEAKSIVETVGEESPSPRPATPSTPPTRQQFWRPPLRLRVTQRGVIDLAAVLAHTGTAAASTMPPGVNASPVVGVGDGADEARDATSPPVHPPSPDPPPARETKRMHPPQIVESPPPAAVEPLPEQGPARRPAPLPNARTLVGHLAPEPAPTTRRFASSEPPLAVRSDPPARPRSDPPPRPRSDPPARPRSDPPLHPRSDPPLQARSDPPALPRSDPPARPRSDPPARPRSDPPARPRSDPPARPRSDPPAGPRSDPPEQRQRADAPDGVIALRDVPSGWSPDPSIGGADAVDELRAIREQLYRFAVRGCFVVGVTSSPDAVEGKSRIAARLASVLAEPGRARVLLMEGDFDGPAVHRLMRIEMPLAFGFSEQVRRRMKQPKPAPWSIVRCSANLQVLAEGRVRAPGMLSSVQFVDGLSELRRYYDLIVLDGPMAGSVDARVLDEISDGLVVVGPNEAAMPEIRKNAAQWFSKKGWMATLPAEVSRDKF
jgi:Mrp family chromosome partitioning ATPase